MIEILVGRNAVREALRAGRRTVERVLLAEGVEPGGVVAEIVALCQQASISVSHVPRVELDRLGRDLLHQGVAAQVSPYPLADWEEILSMAAERDETPFILALDSVQDPQNVGSLLRTAEAVGVHGVVIPRRRAAGITPAVSRASAGAVEHLRIAAVTNLARTLDLLKREGLWVVGVEEHPQAQDYRMADLNLPLVMVLGGEGTGLGRLIADKCDLLVRLPMRGQIHSLNVAAAGAVMLYQAWHARARGGAAG
jgi:23S rRNA (guanosine2251-2'-O)-methyltransferase